VRRLHPFREANDGTADWQIDAGRFVVLYDHPHRNNIDVVHIVTAWPKRRKPRRHLRLISDDPDSYPEA
jgi:hypothetical protein